MSGNYNPLPPIPPSDPEQQNGVEFLYALAQKAEQDGDFEHAELYYRRALDLALLMRQPRDSRARQETQQKKAALFSITHRQKRRLLPFTRSYPLFYINIFMVMYVITVIILELFFL